MSASVTIGPQWVPLIEGWRIIGRHLGVSANDHFSAELSSQAGGILTAAAREGRVKSEGWRDQSIRPERLTAQDWQSLRVDINGDRLLERVSWTRRIPHPDRIVNVVVDASDIRRLLALIPGKSGDAMQPNAVGKPTETSPASESEQKTQSTTGIGRVPSRLEAERLLTALRARIAPRLPSSLEDEEEIEMYFPGAPRSHARAARKKLLPTGGYKSGPKGPRNNPAADK